MCGSGAHILDKSSGRELDTPGMCTAKPIEYSPTTASRASSLAMALSAGDELVSLTMLRSADRESLLTCALTFVPGNHSLIAMRRARASHVVLKPESPTEAPNFLRSHSVSFVANYWTGLCFSKRTPPMPHGHASVAM